MSYKEVRECEFAQYYGDIDICLLSGKDCKPTLECILLLTKQLHQSQQDLKVAVEALEKIEKPELFYEENILHRLITCDEKNKMLEDSEDIRLRLACAGDLSDIATKALAKLRKE